MNNFFELSKITFTRNEWNVTIVYNLRHESGISRRHAVRKICWFHFTSLLLAGGFYLWNSQQRKAVLSFHYRMPYYYFCSVSYWFLTTKTRIFSRNVSFSSLNWSPFGLCSEVLYRRIRNYDRFHYNHHIYRNRSGHLGISHAINPAPITHPVFRLLETSLKPEPFYGYIAVIFPVCLNTLLRFKNCDKVALWKSRTFLFYFPFSDLL